MASPERAGASVRATFNEATDPKTHVTGASTTPSANSDVLSRRFTPVGWDIAVEKNGSRPWLMACAGQAKNQRKRALSPQPHVVVDAGWFAQTFHHTRTASTR